MLKTNRNDQTLSIMQRLKAQGMPGVLDTEVAGEDDLEGDEEVLTPEEIEANRLRREKAKEKARNRTVPSLSPGQPVG